MIFSSPLFATPVSDDLFWFRLPEKLGVVEEAYRGEADEAVILVANPLGNPNGQKQVADIIKLLRDSGAAREAITIAAADLDSGELYLAQERAYAAVKALPTTQVMKLEELYRQAEEKVFTSELQKFLSQQDAYAQNQLSPFLYCRFLAASLRRHNQAVPPHSVMEKLLRAGEIEEKIRYAKVDEERKSVLRRLQRTLPDAELKQLAKLGAKLRAGEIPALPYYAFIDERLTPKEKEVHANLASYIQIVRLQAEISQQVLNSEIARVEEKLTQAMATSVEAQSLLQRRREFFLYKKMLALQLSRAEWEECEKKKLLLSAPFLAEEFSRLSGAPLTATEKEEIAKLDERFKYSSEFYHAAVAREKNWLPALDAKMRDQNTQTAILIAGAFHLPALAQELVHQKISYLLIAPREKEKEAWLAAAPLPVLKPGSATSLEILRALAQTLDEATLVALVNELRRKSALPAVRELAQEVSTADAARRFVLALPETRANFLTQGKAKETANIVRQQKEKLAQLFAPFLGVDFFSMSVTDRLNLMDTVSSAAFQTQLQQLSDTGTLTKSSLQKLLETSLKNPAMKRGALRLTPAVRDALSLSGIDPDEFAAGTHELKLLLEEQQLKSDVASLSLLLSQIIP